MVRRLGFIRPLLSGRASDLSTEGGRSSERHRRMIRSILAAVLARGTGVVTNLAMVPLTLHYLGADRYGMWVTLSSFQALLSFADLGIGNGILNTVTRSAAAGDHAALRASISTAYIAMTCVAFGLIAIFWAGYGFIAWRSVYNVSDALATAEAGPATAIFACIFALNLSLGLVGRIQEGLQEGYAASLWQGCATVLTLLSVLLAIHLRAGLPWLVLALAGTPAAVTAVNAVSFFRGRHRDVAPAMRWFDGGALREIMSSGILFLILQICMAVGFSSNSMVIAQVLGSRAVAPYSVADRLFSVVTILMTLALTPLWPAYGDAIARGDGLWVRRTLRRSLAIATAVSVVVSGAVLVMSPLLVRWWIGSTYAIPFALLAGFAVWRVVETIGNAVAMFLNGAGSLVWQVVFAVAMASSSIVLKIVLVRHIGVPGAIIGMTGAYVFWAIPLVSYAVYRALPPVSGSAR